MVRVFTYSYYIQVLTRPMCSTSAMLLAKSFSWKTGCRQLEECSDEHNHDGTVVSYVGTVCMFIYTEPSCMWCSAQHRSRDGGIQLLQCSGATAEFVRAHGSLEAVREDDDIRCQGSLFG